MKSLLPVITILCVSLSLSACENAQQKAQQAAEAVEKARSVSEDLRKEAGRVKETLLGRTEKSEPAGTEGREPEEKDRDGERASAGKHADEKDD